MALLGISLSIVLPRFIGTLDNIRLKTSTKRVASCLRYARSRAIALKTTTSISFGLEDGSIKVKADNPPVKVPSAKEDDDNNKKDLPFIAEKSRSKGGSVELYDSKLPGEVEMQAWSEELSDVLLEGTVTIEFYPKGNSSGGTLFLLLQNGHYFVIEVDAVTGRVLVTEEFADYIPRYTEYY